MKFQITLNDPIDIESQDGETLSNYQSTILKSLLSASTERSLSMNFTPENQQKIAEEIGYRRALLSFISYFEK